MGRELEIGSRTGGIAGRYVWYGWAGIYPSRLPKESSSLVAAVQSALAHIDGFRRAGMVLRHTMDGVEFRVGTEARWTRMLSPGRSAAAANRMFRRLYPEADRATATVFCAAAGCPPGTVEKFSETVAALPSAATAADMRAYAATLSALIQTRVSDQHSATQVDAREWERLANFVREIDRCVNDHITLYGVEVDGNRVAVLTDANCAEIVARTVADQRLAPARVVEFASTMQEQFQPGRGYRICFVDAHHASNAMVVTVSGLDAVAALVGEFWPFNNTKVLLDAITGQSYGDFQYSSVAVSPSRQGKPPVMDYIAQASAAAAAVEASTPIASVPALPEQAPSAEVSTHGPGPAAGL